MLSEPAAAAAAVPGASGRDALVAEAMRGLSYDSGVVGPDEEADAVLAERWAGESAGELVQRGEDHWRGTETVQRSVLGAIRDFTLAVLVDPQDPRGYRGLGRVHLALHRIDDAIPSFQTALQIDPSVTEGRYKLGMALQMKGRLADAVEAWGDLVALDPEHADGHARLAIGLYYLHEYEGAWIHVHSAESLGGRVPPQFRVLLAERPGSAPKWL